MAETAEKYLKSTSDISRKWLNMAFILSMITIFYNIAEGFVSTIFGTNDKTLVLLGFGSDSFVEVISGIGIAHLVWRMQHSPVQKRDHFETRALRITGVAFYLLVAGLLAAAVFSLVYDITPTTTLPGVIIAIISIGTMYFLYMKKLQVGKKLDSAAIISDAHCTKTCFYLSIILLSSSAAYEWLAIPYIDIAGSLGIGWYAFKEGREAFEKANSLKIDSCCE